MGRRKPLLAKEERGHMEDGAELILSASEQRRPEAIRDLQILSQANARRGYSALMLARNSELPLVLLSLSISNSMASTGERGFSTLRRTQMRDRSSFGISSSSLRVPER